MRFLISLLLLVPLLTNASPFINGSDVKNIKVINYFAEWCTTCRIEIPMLNELNDKGIQVAGVNFDMPSDEAGKEIIKSLGIKFPVFKRDRVDTSRYPIPPVLPATYIMKEGRVVKSFFGKLDNNLIYQNLD